MLDLLTKVTSTPFNNTFIRIIY